MDAAKNFAYGTVATAPSPATSGTSLTLGSGQGALMPTVPFNATVWPAGGPPGASTAEIVRVTAVSGDVLTITRAQEGTSARTVVVGDQVAATITAKFRDDLATDFLTSKATLAGGTVTTSKPPLTITQTWNDAAVTFTGAVLNVTDTASAAGSRLADWQVGGTTKAYVSKGGNVVGTGTTLTDLFARSSSTVTGLYDRNGAGQLGLVANGTVAAVCTATGYLVVANNILAWDTPGGNGTLCLVREANHTLAQRLAGNNQIFNHYARDEGPTNRNYLAIRHASTTLTNVSGATVTATGLIPAGAVVLGISTRVTTALGVSNGTTGYEVGDGTDTDRWGAVTGTAAGTKTTNANWTAASVPIFTAAQNLVITAVGGNFDATGVIYVDVSYAFGDAN